MCFLKNNINHLCLEFKNVIFELNEEYLGHIENQKESIIRENKKNKWNSFLLHCLKLLDTNGHKKYH